MNESGCKIVRERLAALEKLETGWRSYKLCTGPKRDTDATH